MSLNGEWDFQPIYLDDQFAKEKGIEYLEKKYPEEIIEENLPKIISGEIKFKTLPEDIQDDLKRAYNIYRFTLVTRLKELSHEPPDILKEKIIVPSFWTYTRDFEYPERWRNAHAAWHHKSFTIPKEWKENIIKLRFDAVNFEATVFVNGKFVDKHVGGFTPFELDITDAVIFGQENKLMVYVQDVTSVLNEEGEYTAPIAESENQRGIWQDVSLKVYPKVYIDDIIIETSFREQFIKADICIYNMLQHEVYVNLKAEVIEGLELGSKIIKIKPEDKLWVTFKKKWLNPIYWSPQNPYLYKLKTNLSVATNHQISIFDERYENFGFREFWIENKYFFLNGKRINLKGDSINRIPGAYVLTTEYIKTFFEVAKNTNINIIRLHTIPFPEFVLDIADKIGMLIIDESPIMGWTAYDFSDMTNFKNFFEGWIRRDRNHPSAIIWSACNECIRYISALNKLTEIIKKNNHDSPIKFEGSGDAFGFLSIFDTHEYPMDLFKMFNIITKERFPNNYNYLGQVWKDGKPITSGEFSPMYYASPDQIAFLGSEEVYKKIFNNSDGYNEAIANYVSLQIKMMRIFDFAHIAPWSTLNYGLQWFKMDIPYSKAPGTKLFNISMSPKRVEGHYSFTLNPGFDPGQPLLIETPIYKKVKEAFEPIALFMREYNKTFYEKENVERNYVLFNDTMEDIDFRINWEIIDKGKVIKEESKTVHIKAGYSYKGKIDFITPQVESRQYGEESKQYAVNSRQNTADNKPREDIVIKVKVFNKSKKTLLIDKIFNYNIFPKKLTLAPIPELDNLQIALYDKTGKTAKVLESLNAKYSAITDFNNLKSDVLIIGKDNMQILNSQLPTLNSKLLKDYVENGGVILVLDQSDLGNKKWLPIDLSLKDMKTVIGFNLAKGHPVFTDINDDDLTFWGKDYLISNSNFIKPQSGFIKSLIDVGGEDGLNYTPLLEIKYGKGRFILSQMLLVDKFFDEPVAAILLRNLLSYSAKSVENQYTDKIMAVTNNEGSDLVKFLKELQIENLQVTSLEGAGIELTHDSRLITRNTLVILDCQSLDWNAFEMKKQMFIVFLNNGGKMIVHGLHPFNVHLFNNIFKLDLKMKGTSLLHPQVEKSAVNETLWGISNYDLFWSWDTIPVNFVFDNNVGYTLIREPLKTNSERFEGECCWGDYLRFAQAEAKEIKNPGGALIKIPYGKGEILINQILPLSSEPKAKRYFSTLLTNALEL